MTHVRPPLGNRSSGRLSGTTLMGFAFSYRTTRPINPDEAEAVRAACEAASAGRTWLGCEPLFLHVDEDGHLIGFSKPNVQPHPDDAAAAERAGVPDGTLRDAVDVLCRLSREHGIDWRIGHDYVPELGLIRAGACDASVMEQVETLADVCQTLGELDLNPDEDA